MFIAELEHPDFDQFDWSSLRTVVMAGASCPIEVMKRVVDDMGMSQVTICYGMTETSPVSFQSHVDDPINKRVATVGRIHPHVQVKVIDEDGRPVPRGQKGELCTRGYSIMLGYWDDPEKSDEAIDSAGWMHTGDLAVIDDEGFCNIVGRVSKGPQLDETLYGGLNTEFVLTRSVRDAAAVLDSVCGRATGDPFSLPRPAVSFTAASKDQPRLLRVAVQTESAFAQVSPELARAADQVALSLEAEGHVVVESSPDVDADDWTIAERIIWIQSTAWEIKRLSQATGNPVTEQTLEPLSLVAYELAKGLTADDWFDAKRRCNSICRNVGSFFDDINILVTPTVAGTAPMLGEIAGSGLTDYDKLIASTGEFSPFTSLFNITVQPANSLPLAVSESGLPIGVQFVARYGNEALLLQLVTHLEHAMPWKDRVPPVHVSHAGFAGGSQ